MSEPLNIKVNFKVILYRFSLLITECCFKLISISVYFAQMGSVRYSDRSIFRQVYIPTGRFSDRSIFRQVDIPTGRYSDRSLFRQVVIPTGRYSDKSLFRQFYVPTSRYSDRSLFRQVRSFNPFIGLP